MIWSHSSLRPLYSLCLLIMCWLWFMTLIYIEDHLFNMLCKVLQSYSVVMANNITKSKLGQRNIYFDLQAMIFYSMKPRQKLKEELEKQTKYDAVCELVTTLCCTPCDYLPRNDTTHNWLGLSVSIKNQGTLIYPREHKTILSWQTVNRDFILRWFWPVSSL